MSLPVRLSVRAAAIVLLFVCFAVTSRSQSMPGYQAPEKAKDQISASVKATYGAAPLANLYGHLMPDAARVKRLPPLDPNSIPKQEGPQKILNIGVVRTLPSDLNPMTDSAMYGVVEGYVRIGAVTSPGAASMRLHFKDFSLPAGARAFVYSSARPDLYFGPYEGKGPWGDGVFWTPPVRGDQVIIEYQVSPGIASEAAPFKVQEVSHVYNDIFSVNNAAGACNLEVPPEWAGIAKSVGLLDFMTEGGEAVCTGTLLNDADPTQDHHVLTANHCIDAEFEAQSVTIYWNYNTGDSPPGGTPTTSGAHVVTTTSGLDFTLLRLTGPLPGGLFFSGWDANAVTNGTSVTGIHHPLGSHKRISFGATNSDCDSQLPSSCSNFTGVTWNQGITENGSSGSGLWTGTGDTAKLVGTLLGGGSACNNLSGTDFYSRFSVIYPSVAQFLEPLRTLTVTSVNPSTVGIIVLLNGNNQPSGSTPFTRTYFHNSSVTLTAASTLVNGNTFQKWQRDGADFTTSPSTTVTMDANHTMTAVYLSAPTVVLTVASSNPSSGVNITVTPNDNDGLGNGTTQFTRTYNKNTNANLTAPSSLGASIFWKWQRDGVDFSTNPAVSVAMDGAHTATAIYFTPGPTPAPTPAPGAGTQPIAFVKAGTNSPGTDLFLTNVDGMSVVNLTDAYGDDTLPAWSPDGSRLAYTCLRQPDGSIGLPRRICVRNGDGTGFAVLSNTPADDYGPAWSRDGSLLAFTTSTSGSQTMIGLMNADGTGRVTLLPGAANPDWSPDNSTLLFQSGISLWTYNRATQTTQQLTFATIDSRPRYSPDGAKIVFERIRDSALQIYVMNSDGSNQTRLSNLSGWDLAPAWSPDGTKILFTSTRNNETALYVMSPDGSNVTRVTAGSDAVWRAVPTIPVVATEAGSNNVVAVNSVTFLSGPFQILDAHNFSTDGHTRLILFTSNLAMFSPPLPSTSILSVAANGVNLPVERVGPLTGVTGISGSFIVVRLPDQLPTGNLSLTVTARGVTSAATILPIGP
jgi:Tol biopolymer transport system component